jgi:hypothetical protein
MNDKHEQLTLAFATYMKEIENFDKNGVKVSAARARQALSEIKKLIPDLRSDIQKRKDEM